MGKRNKSRQARRHQVDNVVWTVLKSHAQANTPARAAARFGDFKPEYRDKVKTLRSYDLRAPDDWVCRIKSKSEDKRFIDFIRFAFARYRVAPHIEQLWIDDVDDDFVDRITLPDRVAMERPGMPDLLRWYLIAAQGGSLYKQETNRFLSKQETHFFLTAPDEISSTKRALWYAVARAQTPNREIALRVSRCKLANYSVASTWWKEVARFFARNPLLAHEMDDLVDYLFVAKQENARFTLKGRTFVTLRRRIKDWHHLLRRSQAIGGGAWAGSPLPDVDYKTGSEDKRAIWRVRQIKTGNGLFQEGQRMHHCVAGYKQLCVNGDVSIWSLTSEFPLGQLNRGVTMEVTRDHRIVQCRGFANRLPYGNEATMAKRWANEYGLTWLCPER